MKEIDPRNRIYKTFKNLRIEILGEIRTIPEVKLTLVPMEGKWSMSFDEYNRIANDIHLELKKKRKVR